MESEHQEFFDGQGQELNPDMPSPLEHLDRCLDEGIVLEGSACVSSLDMEVFRADVRVFMASLETYLKDADVIEQTDNVVLADTVEPEQLPPPEEARHTEKG